MFWGLIMEPHKRYSQVVEKPFHISQAALDTSSGDNDPSQVMVIIDGKNFLICTLQKNRSVQVPLDLYFKSGEAISFLCNGKSNVHMMGYLDPEFEDEPSDDEEEEDEEVPALVPAKHKRKIENNHDATPSKKAKTAKAPAPADSSDSDEDDDNNLQKLLDGDIDSDENDDSFKINTSNDSDDDNEGDDDEEEEEDDDEEADEEAEAEEDGSEEESAPDTSKEEPELDLSKLSKNQRRKLKLKQKKEQMKQPQVNGVDKTQEKKQDKKEKKKEAKKEEASAEKKEKKSLSGGVQIEDLKVGNGPAAKPGKTIMVYYEGRLKQNNKKFDDCVKGPGFKFRLGAKEVITGWDVGIAGMKAGGKRRIVCPPAMAYGAKGSPPVIPPNSTLVFEVELKEVK